MFTPTRVRGVSSCEKSRVPSGAFPLIIALSILIATPIAGAATNSDGPTGAPEQTGETPIVKDAALTPRLSARLSDPRSVAGDGIRVRGKVTGIGRTKVKVFLTVRRSGTKTWKRVAAGKVRGGAKFALGWRGGRPGAYAVRLAAVKGKKSDSAVLGKSYVFRRSHASYYGPGLYGGALACGGRLSPSTVGVAHKTLRCGTKVTFNYGKRTVTARVIDRGPFIAGRDWDLTAALKRKLGFGSTGTVNVTH